MATLRARAEWRLSCGATSCDFLRVRFTINRGARRGRRERGFCSACSAAFYVAGRCKLDASLKTIWSSVSPPSRPPPQWRAGAWTMPVVVAMPHTAHLLLCTRVDVSVVVTSAAFIRARATRAAQRLYSSIRTQLLRHLLCDGRAGDLPRSCAARMFDVRLCEFHIAPSGTTPVVTYRHSAITSLRATATIPIRRARLPVPKCSRYHRVRARAVASAPNSRELNTDACNRTLPARLIPCSRFDSPLSYGVGAKPSSPPIADDCGRRATRAPHRATLTPRGRHPL